MGVLSLCDLPLAVIFFVHLHNFLPRLDALKSCWAAPSSMWWEVTSSIQEKGKNIHAAMVAVAALFHPFPWPLMLDSAVAKTPLTPWPILSNTRLCGHHYLSQQQGPLHGSSLRSTAATKSRQNWTAIILPVWKRIVAAALCGPAEWWWEEREVVGAALRGPDGGGARKHTRTSHCCKFNSHGEEIKQSICRKNWNFSTEVLVFRFVGLFLFCLFTRPEKTWK